MVSAIILAAALVALAPPPAATQEYTNVALNKPTEQSDDWIGDRGLPYSSNLAVDGRTANRMSDWSCSHTKSNKNAWWKVDLLKPYLVRSVKITFRGLNLDRMKGSQILLMEEDDVSKATSCTYIFSYKGTVEFYCGKPTKARYVMIKNSKNYVTLCEVEVMGKAVPDTICQGSQTNLALNKPTEQMDDWGSFTSDLAVDGSTKTAMWGMSCSHTGDVNDAWWRVDLQKLSKVQSVKITFRGDCPHCAGRMKGARILLMPEFDTATASVCATIGDYAIGETKEYKCEGKAQYVVVHNPSNYVTLCEVQVMGC